MIEKIKAMNFVAVSSAITLVVGIFVAILILSPNIKAAESEVVTSFSDDGTRRGNNVYGYVNIPEQLTEMTGSFNSASDVYGGIQNGINKGVRFSGEGSLYMSMTILDVSNGLEDYIAIGENDYVAFGKKGKALDSEKAQEQFAGNLLESGRGITCVDGRRIRLGDVEGMEARWEMEENGSTIFYKVYFLDSPNSDNVVHCICARYNESEMDSLDSLSTFSFSGVVREDRVSLDKVVRVGNDVNGYVNIPEGYYTYLNNYKGNGDINAVYMCNKKDWKEEKTLNESMAMVALKQVEVENNVLTTVKDNLTDMLAHLNIYKWSDTINDGTTHLYDNVRDESTQLNAESISGIIRKTLDQMGDVQCTTTELGGMKGYQITWAGRYDNQEKGYATFCVLDSATGDGMVYIVAARTNVENGTILQLPASYSFEK